MTSCRGLSWRSLVVAGLLLTVIAKEIHDKPKVHDLAKGSSSDQGVWNGFSSESQHATAMRGGFLKAALPASRRGRRGSIREPATRGIGTA